MAVFNKMYTKSRFRFNLIILFLMVFYFTSVSCQWPPSFSKKQVRIYEGAVPEKLYNIMPYEPFEYSEANVSRNYASSTKFQSKGMGHLYYFTNFFINNLIKDQAYPEGFLQVVDGNSIQLTDVRSEWKTYWKHYGPTVGVILTFVAIGILLPIFGLLFCCCRCTGRCNARTQPFDKRYDFCRRHTFGMILCAITVLISFGVVCSFVTNENLEDGTINLPKELKTSIADVNLYINNTKAEVSNLLVYNFHEFETSMIKALRASGEIVKNKLGSVSKASVLTNLTNIVHGLSAIRKDLKDIDSLTRSLQDTAAQLETALQEFRARLLSKLEQCKKEKACRDLTRKYKINELSLEANFSKLPNVTASLQNISELISSDIEQEVLKGKKSFDDIKDGVQKTVNDHIPNIQDYINKTGQRLRRGSELINDVLDRFNALIINHGSQSITHGENILKDYGYYRYYVGLGVSCILLTVLLCLTLGLLCGFCGSRPDTGYSDDCCNKGSGSSFLMIGIWVMFISSAALAFVVLIYFLTGITAERVVCEPLKHPDNSRIFNLLDELVDLGQIIESDDISEHERATVKYRSVNGRLVNSDKEEVPFKLKISEIIRSCHKNNSLLNVLKLRNNRYIDDLLKYPETKNLRIYVDHMTSSITLNTNVKILTPEATEQLLRLSLSPLSEIDFPSYTHILGEQITSIDLMELSKGINDTIDKLPESQIELKRVLKSNVMYLKVDYDNHVVGMLDTSRRLESAAKLLNEHLKFNHSSLREAVDSLLLDVELAQNMLDKEGPNLITKLSKEFGAEFEKHIDYYISRVLSNIESDVGKCWPLSIVYNATVNASCNKILYPHNGFWFSTGCVLLLFIPAIYISVKLASLYQKSDPYPGPLVEAEYLYDAYADRDNIPLSSNVNGKKKKKKTTHNHHHESATNYGGSGGVGADGMNPDYSAHLGRNERNRLNNQSATSASTSNGGVIVSGGTNIDPRFSDIASKNWDFPNGGPPRYQSTPTPMSTEYERPPPYYYPGPGPK